LIAWQTFANHRPYRGGVEHLALGVDTARFSDVARVDAFLVDASRMRRAVRIVPAGEIHFGAAMAEVPDVTRRARAVRLVVVDLALGRRLARVRRRTWVRALRVDTRAVARAIRVASALQKNAGDLWVAAQARRALTHGAVVGAVASRLSAARAAVWRAHWHAVPVDAHVLSRAVGVASAADFRALDFGVAVVARLAGADGLVVLDAALRVRAAVARVSADPSDARFVGRAVGVAAAFAHGRDWRRRDAGSASAADVAWRADAQQGANRHCIHDLALAGLFARLEHGARVLTLFVEAGQPRWAVRVLPTLGPRLGPTAHVGVADHARRAAAHGEMVLDPAFGSGRAWVLVDARVDALGVDAGSVARTVVAGAAAHDVAALVWVPAVPAQAAALGTVTECVALGVRSARLSNDARVDTVSVDASLIRSAFRITAAANWKKE